ncbi:MAG TPA: LUD domain-containing protein [Solirubrobacteraceae bacterium]|nr:LUD domain-containing protein [Solirubrobacteraceae bacterium]
MSDPRAVVLGRIRDALGAAPTVPEVPRAYRQAGTVAADVERFCSRVADYRATVHRVSADDLAAAVRQLCPGRTAVAPSPPCALAGIDAVLDDPPLSVDALDALDAVLTGAVLGIAETGTIVLDGSAACGRRALTLVPDHHVCVIGAEHIVATVPDAVGALSPAAPLTFVSGPSATSDIELERVEGVHGPRRLDVVVVIAPSS